MAVSDTLIGTLFDGRYQVVRKLGAGGMANVYLAEDQELGRRVAIKILNDRHANDDQFVERFRREAKNAAALSHPNIVSIYDRGEAEGTYYIAMEFLDGRSLKELIVSRGPAPISVSVEYARQILQALRFAHRHGIVHRDIKPHNVLVDAEGRVKVTDFGIARAGTSQMTEAGSIVGTAQYLSPEQARGTNVDQRSDVYSLGIVLYELLTGTVPFNGDTPVEIAMKHLSTVPEPPSTKRPEIPRDLDLIVMRALAKDPADRYQSAEEMDADLERFARGSAVSPETEESATQIMRAPVGPLAATAATMISPRAAHDAAAASAAARLLRPRGADSPAAGLAVDRCAPLRDRRRRRRLAPLQGDLEQAELDEADPGEPVPERAGDAGAAEDHSRRLRTARRPSLEPHDADRARVQADPGRRQAHRRAAARCTIYVSTGLPKVEGAEPRRPAVDLAVAALTRAHLKPDIHNVPSSKPAGEVLAQEPPRRCEADAGKPRADQRVEGAAAGVGARRVGEPIDQATSSCRASASRCSRAMSTTPSRRTP